MADWGTQQLPDVWKEGARFNLYKTSRLRSEAK